MKPVLIFLRHLADYIVGLTYIIISLTAGLLIVGEHFPDAEPEIKFFVWVVTFGVIGGIYAIIADTIDHTKNDLNPKEKHIYNIEIKSEKVDDEYTCSGYTIDHRSDHIILTMGGTETYLPIGTSIIVTALE